MYGFSVRLDGPFDEVIPRVTQALAAHGFGVLTDIDVASTLRAKLGVDRRPYRILGACNPGFADQAIRLDPEIGLLLPCNVVVREEEDGAVVVSFMDPLAVLPLADHPEIPTIAAQVRDLLEQVRQRLEG
jgi:uncharacterized protein (DUF302 family)